MSMLVRVGEKMGLGQERNGKDERKASDEIKNLLDSQVEQFITPERRNILMKS